MAWHLLKQGEENGEYSNHMEFLIDSATDISSPPTTTYKYAPGSFAHTAGFGKIYESDASGSWHEIGA